MSSKKKWIFPKKNKLIIIDDVGSDKIKKCLLADSNFTVMHTRGEVFYIPIILISIKYFLKYGFKSYHIAFINYVNPKLAISFIDNAFYYANIMSAIPGCKYFMIMNGRRHDTFFDEIDNFKKLKIDKYFVYGEDFKNYVKEKIPNTIVSGSIIANHYLRKKEFKRPKKIQYISLFQSSYYEKKGYFDLKREWQGLDNNFYMPTTEFTLKILKKFSLKNSLELEIIPRTNWKQEEEFYSQMIDGYTLNKKIGFAHSYNLVSDEAIIIGCTSTFTMECFAAGYRTGFLTFRQHVIPPDHPEAFRYVEWAWPGKTEKQGFFWSNIKEELAITSVLNNLLHVDQNKWESIYKPYRDKLMTHDDNNKIIKSYIESEKIN